MRRSASVAALAAVLFLSSACAGKAARDNLIPLASAAYQAILPWIIDGTDGDPALIDLARDFGEALRSGDRGRIDLSVWVALRPLAVNGIDRLGLSDGVRAILVEEVDALGELLLRLVQR